MAKRKPLQLSEKAHRLLKREAEKRGMLMRVLAERAIKEYLTNKK